MATPTTLPASFIAGSVLTAAEMNDLRGAFRVLQVVQGTSATETTTTSTSYVTTTLSASITPSSTSSKILIMQTGMGFVTPATKGGNFTIFRGTVAGTNLAASGTGFNIIYSSSTDLMTPVAMQYLDSPATTSATTYTIGMRVDSGGTLQVQRSSATAVLILMEVSA
jgi:hypothetical protein